MDPYVLFGTVVLALAVPPNTWRGVFVPLLDGCLKLWDGAQVSVHDVRPVEFCEGTATVDV